MAYCIMNVDKQRRSAVYGLQIEANRVPEDRDRREFAGSDIDWDRTHLNIRLRYTENWNTEITRQIHVAGLNERKNSIVMLTAVYTASPEWFEGKTIDQILPYFKECIDYHERTYGTVLNAVIHLDEKTPHMQVFSIPIIEDEKGKHLSAKMIMGGRSDYQRRQDEFYEQVGKKYGLERGERRGPEEQKKHLTVLEYKNQQEELKTQKILEHRAESVQNANSQKLDALRQRDEARAAESVAHNIIKACKGLESNSMAEQVLERRTRRKSILGLKSIGYEGDTVEIPEKHYRDLLHRAGTTEHGLMLARRLESDLAEMQQAAAELSRNYLDSVEIAKDKTVRQLLKENRSLQEELSELHRRLEELETYSEAYQAIRDNFPEELDDLLRKCDGIEYDRSFSR